MRAILFDIGNVLIRYSHQRTLAALAACCGVEVAAAEAAFQEVHEAFGLGRLDAHGFCAHMVARTGARGVTCEQLWEAFCAGLARDDEALAYVMALRTRPGVTVGAISNTNAVHVAWLDSQVPELALLDLVVMSNEVELLKPDLEVFELALELLEMTAAQALYVDDAPLNVAAAQAVGLTGVVHQDWAITRFVIEEWLEMEPHLQ